MIKQAITMLMLIYVSMQGKYIWLFCPTLTLEGFDRNKGIKDKKSFVINEIKLIRFNIRIRSDYSNFHTMYTNFKQFEQGTSLLGSIKASDKVLTVEKDTVYKKTDEKGKPLSLKISEPKESIHSNIWKHFKSTSLFKFDICDKFTPVEYRDKCAKFKKEFEPAFDDIMEESFKNNVYSCLVYEHKDNVPEPDVSLYIKPNDNFLDKAILAESNTETETIFKEWDKQGNVQENTKGNAQENIKGNEQDNAQENEQENAQGNSQGKLI